MAKVYWPLICLPCLPVEGQTYSCFHPDKPLGYRNSLIFARRKGNSSTQRGALNSCFHIMPEGWGTEAITELLDFHFYSFLGVGFVDNFCLLALIFQ